MGAGQARAGQGGVGAVAGEVKAPFRQPAGDLADHLGSQLGGRLPAALGAHPQVHRERDRGAAPRRVHAQADHDEVQAPGVDDPLAGGADRVAEGACPGHLPPGLVRQGVIDQQFHHAFGPAERDGVHGQDPPQIRGGPFPGPDEPVAGVVGAPTFGVAEGEHPGDGAPARGQRPVRQPYFVI